MVDPLHVDTEGMLAMAKLHGAVSDALGHLQLGDDVPAVGTSHGVVASPVSSALGGVLASRGNILQSTSTSGRQISSLLQDTADAYRAGDEHGAARLSAAGEATGGHPGVGSAAMAAPAAPAGGAPSGGAQMGQVLSQVGQVVQSVVQPIQGLAQSLGQLPGQLMGGLGSIGDAAQLGGSTPTDHSMPAAHSGPGHSSSDASATHDPGHAKSDSQHDKHGPHDKHDDRAEEKHDRNDQQVTTEEVGESSTAAQELRADMPARRPAPTRPQD